MDEGFETSVDTSDIDSASSDVANEAPIEEASDMESDIPEDVLDDASIEETSDLESDIPEDVVDDTPIEETSDMESDIPEDVVDDTPIEETSDMESDIPEDVVDDAPSEETSDMENDIPEDVVDDTPIEEASDMESDIPEDVVDDALSEETSDMESDIPEDEVDEMPIGNSINDTSEMPDDLQSEEDLNDIAENDETVSNYASGTEDELVAEDELGNEIEDQIAESVTGNVVEEQPAGNEKNQLEESSDILNNGEFSENESVEDEANPNEAEKTEEEKEKSQLEEGSDLPNAEEFKENESDIGNETRNDVEEQPIENDSVIRDVSEAAEKEPEGSNEQLDGLLKDNICESAEGCNLDDAAESEETGNDIKDQISENENKEKPFYDKIKDAAFGADSAYDVKKYEKAGINGAFDELPRDRREAVYEAFENAPNEIKAIVNDLSSELSVENTQAGDCCHYDPRDKMIRMEQNMDNDEYSEVFSHEYGHFVDHKKGDISDTKEFRDAMNFDLEKYDRSRDDVKQSFTSMLDELMNTDAAYDRAISDNMSAFFVNDSEIIQRYHDEGIDYYQHSNNYWMRKGNREAEIYANLFSMIAQDNKSSCTFMSKYFPNTWNHFKQTL